MFYLESDGGAEGRQTNLANLCQLCVMFSRISARENVVFSFHALLFYDARSLPNLFVGAESAPDPTGGAYDALQSPDPLVNYERWTPLPIPHPLESRLRRRSRHYVSAPFVLGVPFFRLHDHGNPGAVPPTVRRRRALPAAELSQVSWCCCVLIEE